MAHNSITGGMMDDLGLWAFLGILFLILALLIWYRAKHPTSYDSSMSDEEEQDWMDDLLFPPFYNSCDDSSNDNED